MTSRVVRPGIMSTFPASAGTQKLWMTSLLSSRISTGRPSGMCSSFASEHAGVVAVLVPDFPPPLLAGHVDANRVRVFMRAFMRNDRVAYPERIYKECDEQDAGQDEPADEKPAPGVDSARSGNDAGDRQDAHDREDDRGAGVENQAQLLDRPGGAARCRIERGLHALAVHRYRYAAMSRASASLTSRSGMAVPGSSDGALRIHATRWSGTFGLRPATKTRLR